MKFLKKNLISLAVLAGVLMISVLLFNLGAFQGINRLIYDGFYQMRGANPHSSKIVIVEVDDTSIQVLKKKWAWPRTFFAQAIRKIAQDGPQVIGLDFTFSEPGSPSEDEAMEQALRAAGKVPVVAGMNLSEEKRERLHLGKKLYFIRQTAIGPVFQKMQSGYLNLPKESDGSIWQASLNRKHQGKNYISFAFQLFKNISANHYKYKEKIKQVASNAFFINYNEPSKSFLRLSFYQVYNGLVPKGYFKDKIVLIGPTFSASHDFYSSPYSGTRISGVEVHASIIHNLISNNFHSRLPWQADFLIALIFCGFIFALFLLKKPLLQKSLLSVVVVLLYGVLSYAAFKQLLLLNVFTSVFSLFIFSIALTIVQVLEKIQNLRKELSLLKRTDIVALEAFSAKYDITKREKEVILLIAKKYSNKQMSEKLFVSVNTIKKHINNIYKKLEINNRETFLEILRQEGIG